MNPMAFDRRQIHRDNEPTRSVVDPRRRLHLGLLGFAGTPGGRADSGGATQSDRGCRLSPGGHEAAAAHHQPARHTRRILHSRRNRAGFRPAGLDRCGPLPVGCRSRPTDVGCGRRPARICPRPSEKTPCGWRPKKLRFAASETNLRRRCAVVRRVAGAMERPGRPGPSPRRADRRLREPPPPAQGRDGSAANVAVGPRQPEDRGGVLRFFRGLRPPRLAQWPKNYIDVMVEDVPPTVATEIEGNLTLAGSEIIRQTRRAYPAGTLAAHVLGYLGLADPPPQRDSQPETKDDDTQELTGRAGVERQYQRLLRGRSGEAVELTDHSGRLLRAFHQQEPCRRPRSGADAGCQIRNGRPRNCSTPPAIAGRSKAATRSRPAGPSPRPSRRAEQCGVGRRMDQRVGRTFARKLYPADSAFAAPHAADRTSCVTSRRDVLKASASIC